MIHFDANDCIHFRFYLIKSFFFFKRKTPYWLHLIFTCTVVGLENFWYTCRKWERTIAFRPFFRYKLSKDARTWACTYIAPTPTLFTHAIYSERHMNMLAPLRVHTCMHVHTNTYTHACARTITYTLFFWFPAGEGGAGGERGTAKRT